MNPPTARPTSRRAHLRDLVDRKNAGARPLTAQERSLGFQGWHERGYLPHCDYPGLVQLVTFRLADSLPESCRGELRVRVSAEESRARRTRLESILDQGAGECLLRDPQLGQLVESALLHRHGRHFELLAWVIMPNHVHVLVQVWSVPLGKLMLSWKSYSAKMINRALGREGRLWQPEYWDTFMRDERQLQAAIRYVEANPVNARLCLEPSAWPLSSVRRRDANGMLPLVSEGA